MDQALDWRSGDEDDAAVGEGEDEEDMERLNRHGTCLAKQNRHPAGRRLTASPEPSVAGSTPFCSDPAMSWRASLSSSLQELRVHFCQTSQASASTRFVSFAFLFQFLKIIAAFICVVACTATVLYAAPVTF
jgi:hypothetical protein